MLQLASVVSVDNKKVKLRLGKIDKCDGCTSCYNNQKQEVIVIYEQQGISVGDTVKLNMPDINKILAPLIIFVLPILALIVGLVVGGLINTTMQLVFGFGFFAISFLAVYAIERMINKKQNLQIQIIEVIRLENNI